MEMDSDMESNPIQIHQDRISPVRNTSDTEIDRASIPEKMAHPYGTLLLKKRFRMVINNADFEIVADPLQL